jgi:hypothetical protein
VRFCTFLFAFAGVQQIFVYRSPKKNGHCEPVRTLAWQSPGFSGLFRWFSFDLGDCHVAFGSSQ